jgi:hypothetical protein
MVRIKGVQMWHGQSAYVAFVDADLVSEVYGHPRCSTCKTTLAKPVPLLVERFRATVLPSHLHRLHVAIMTVSTQHSKKHWTGTRSYTLATSAKQEAKLGREHIGCKMASGSGVQAHTAGRCIATVTHSHRQLHTTIDHQHPSA